MDIEPDTNDLSIWLEIRDSQYKCAAKSTWMFECCNVSGPSKAANVNNQMRQVLEGSQSDEKNTAIREYLNDLLELQLSGPQSSVLEQTDRSILRKVVENMQRIFQYRHVSEYIDGPKSRYSDREKVEELFIEMPNTRLGMNISSGQPDSAGEQVMCLRRYHSVIIILYSFI